MKTYEFKSLMLCICFVVLCMSVFIYGIIWLDKGFKQEEMEIRIMRQMEEDKKEILKDYNDLGYYTVYKMQHIMPSCFRGLNKKEIKNESF